MANDNIPEQRTIVTYTEANKVGLARYFTGKPCKYGHVAERHAADGRCCECSRLKQAAWRASDPERARAKYREWKSRNGDAAKAATLAWRARNADKVAAQKKRQYEKHKDKRLAAQAVYNARNSAKIVARVTKWASANPDKVKKNKRAWVERNPDKVRLNGSRHAARRRNAVGTFTQADIDKIFAAQGGKCAYCRTSLASGYDIDHIVPLRRGGTNWPSNLQLCCDSCNSRKNAKDPMVFARSLGLLL